MVLRKSRNCIIQRSKRGVSQAGTSWAEDDPGDSLIKISIWGIVEIILTNRGGVGTEFQEVLKQFNIWLFTVLNIISFISIL